MNWNAIWPLLLSAIGGGGLVKLADIVFKFWLGKDKQQAEIKKQDEEIRQVQLTRLDNRIIKLESDHEGCMEENASLQRELGKLQGEMAGLKVSMSRIEMQGVVAHVTSDSKGIITEWNPGATQIFGWSREEAVGQPVTILVPSRMRGQHDTAFDAAVLGKRGPNAASAVQLRETFALIKDGGEIPVTVTLGGWEFRGDRMYSAEIKRR